MKQKFLVLAIFITSLCSSQEDNKRFIIAQQTWVLGGSINYSSQKQDSNFTNNERTNTRLLISPNIGYAIADNLIIGTSIDYLHIKGEINPVIGFSPNEESSFFGVSPYIVKYFNITKTLLFDVEGQLSYSVGYTEDSVLNSKSDSTLFSIRLLPGITYSINKKVALKLNLGGLNYSKFKIEAKSDIFNINETQDDFGFNFNTSNLRFGIIYLL